MQRKVSTDVIHIIFNPAAGQGRSRRLRPLIQSQLASMGEVSWFPTKGPGEATRLASAALAANATMVVAVGGDGTVNEIVNGLVASSGALPPPLLAVIPVGSSNDFALGLGIADHDTALARIAAGRAHHVDLGRATGDTGTVHYFCVTAGVGFLAAVARERRNVRWGHGQTLYLLAALRVLRRQPPVLPVTLEFDGARREEHAIMTLSVNNCATVGGYALTPLADMKDGHLHALTVCRASRTRLVQLILAARGARHLGQKEIRVDRFRTLDVRSEAPLSLHVDGEALPDAGSSRWWRIECLPAALQVVA